MVLDCLWHSQKQTFQPDVCWVTILLPAISGRTAHNTAHHQNMMCSQIELTWVIFTVMEITWILSEYVFHTHLMLFLSGCHWEVNPPSRDTFSTLFNKLLNSWTELFDLVLHDCLPVSGRNVDSYLYLFNTIFIAQCWPDAPMSFF